MDFRLDSPLPRGWRSVQFFAFSFRLIHSGSLDVAVNRCKTLTFVGDYFQGYLHFCGMFRNKKGVEKKEERET